MLTDEQRAEARRLAEIVIAGWEALDALEAMVGMKATYQLLDRGSSAEAVIALREIEQACRECDSDTEHCRVYLAMSPSIIRAESLNVFLHGD